MKVERRAVVVKLVILEHIVACILAIATTLDAVGAIPVAMIKTFRRNPDVTAGRASI